MQLIDLSAKFVTEVNQMIQKLNGAERTDIQNLADLVTEIEGVQRLLSESVGKASLIIDKMATKPKNHTNMIYIVNGKRPICILGENICKPVISNIAGEINTCQHDIEFTEFKPLKQAIMIQSEAQLWAIDKSITQAAIEVFEHSYRSYSGHACFLVVADSKGNVYIIDAIRFRNSIPKMKFLQCGVPKIYFNDQSFQRVASDFKSGCCSRIYDCKPINIFVDWRIRPLDAFMEEILIHGIGLVVDKINNTEVPLQARVRETTEAEEYQEFIKNFNVTEDQDLLQELMKLRKFIAKSFDESPSYVIPDSQVVEILRLKPKTRSDFLKNFRRLSPLARQHLNDFLFLFNNSGKAEFSVQRLMKSQAAQPGVDDIADHPDETSISEFEISSCTTETSAGRSSNKMNLNVKKYNYEDEDDELVKGRSK